MKAIKPIVVLMLAAGMVACTVKETPFRSARELHDVIGAGWNLGNTLEAYGDPFHGVEEEGMAGLETETSWRNPAVTKAMIDSVKSAGFNAIRIPVRWYPHFKMEDGKLTVDSAWMNRVQQIVDWCLEDDLITLLNTHHELWMESHPFYADSTEVLNKERQLWTAVAEHFKDYDDRLMFLGTNEVHLQGDWGPVPEEQGEMQNVFNQTFIDAVRSTGGNNAQRNLMVQLYYCDPIYNVVHFRLPEDPAKDHLMLEIHLYQPSTYVFMGLEKYWGAEYLEDILSEPVMDFSQNAQGAGNAAFATVTKDRVEQYLAAKKANPQNTDELQLEKTYSDIAAALKPYGLPIVLGETGASRWVDIDAPSNPRNDRLKASRAYYYEYMIKTARKNGFAPFVWDNGSFTRSGVETFGLFDRHNNMRREQSVINAIMRGAEQPYPEVQ